VVWLLRAPGWVKWEAQLMAELVRLNVYAIVAGSNQTVALAKRATTTDPIVMTLGGILSGRPTLPHYGWGRSESPR
jgi:hypothetical protein